MSRIAFTILTDRDRFYARDLRRDGVGHRLKQAPSGAAPERGRAG